MSATRLWYPHYVRDFNAKTSHLSLAERGAYRALMDAYWEAQGPLPADERALCRMIGAFPDEWEQVRENVLSFFENRDGKLYHKRISEEIEKARSQHAEKAERMAKARAKKAERQSIDQLSEQSIDQSIGQCTGQSEGTPTPSPSPSPKNGRTEEPRIYADEVGDVSRETLPSKPKRTPRDALCDILDKERADAVIEHRNRLRAPLTTRAAELLARQLALARDGPAAAADLMLERGWKGFKAEWDRGNDQATVDDARQAILRAVVG